MSSFYTSVPKFMIICYTVSEIWCMTNVIVIFHFELFFALLAVPPPPAQQPEKYKFQNNEKKPIKILSFYTSVKKNHDYILHCSWDMARDGCNCCFPFWAISCPFALLAPQKVKISKQWKKSLEISSSYTSVPKIMIICYTVLEIWHMTHLIVVFHFGQFFPHLHH